MEYYRALSEVGLCRKKRQINIMLKKLFEEKNCSYALHLVKYYWLHVHGIKPCIIPALVGNFILSSLLCMLIRKI